MEISYPALTDSSRNLIGIFTIENAHLDYDIIHLGEIEIGYVTQGEKGWCFTPIAEVDSPFPLRDSYAEVWQDIITLIANDIDLAIEFTIRAQHKSMEG